MLTIFVRYWTPCKKFKNGTKQQEMLRGSFLIYSRYFITLVCLVDLILQLNKLRCLITWSDELMKMKSIIVYFISVFHYKENVTNLCLQIYMDLAVLVDAQGDILNNIESQVNIWSTFLCKVPYIIIIKFFNQNEKIKFCITNHNKEKI